MNIPSVLLDFLRANNIPYEIIPHAKVFTARMAAAAEGIERHHQTKVVMLSTPEGPVMAGVAADLETDVPKVWGILHQCVDVCVECRISPRCPVRLTST